MDKPRTIYQAAELAAELIDLAFDAGDSDDEAAAMVCELFGWTCWPTAQLVVAMHHVNRIEQAAT